MEETNPSIQSERRAQRRDQTIEPRLIHDPELRELRGDDGEFDQAIANALPDALKLDFQPIPHLGLADTPTNTHHCTWDRATPTP